MVYGAALMNEEEKMIGSIIVTNFATRAQAEAWLEADPYVQQNVWGNITLTACKMGPSFEPLFNQIYKKSA